MQKLIDQEPAFESRKSALEQRTAEAEKAIAEMTGEDQEAQEALSNEVNAIENEQDALEKDKAAHAERVSGLQAEIDSVNAELEELNTRAAVPSINPEKKEENKNMENRAEMLHSTNRASYQADEIRSVLVSGGNLATPTGASGIYDQLAPHYSSILDMVSVVNCVGMGSNKVAYMIDGAAADAQTEGAAATAKDATFGFVTITPVNLACQSQISKQARKQSPLQYEAKVSAAALYSLKKAAVAHIMTKLGASALTTAVTETTIGAGTLRKIALNYGGTEGVAGEAVLMLNKANLIAFGDARGTNEKKAVYEITPDAANPNTGIIKDGGLAVRYCLVSNLADTQMFYGNPKCFELDLFSDFEVQVSADFAITSLMDTIVGDCEVGGDVVVSGGFVKVTIGG